MADKFAIDDIASALDAREHPTVTVWNRLEGRPRTVAFDRSLKAEVRDALWMLTRQWQVGELVGEDAGSPVTTRFSLANTPLTTYRPGAGASRPFDLTTALEATVEPRPPAFVRGGRKVELELRLMLGRHWLKLISDLPVNYRQAYIDHYPVALPDPADPADADRCAHPEAWQAYAAAAGRAVDGFDLYAHLTAAPANRAWDSVAVAAGDRPAIDARAEDFVEWANRSVVPAADAGAWIPERLEYQLECSGPSATGTRRFVAEEYARGSLDWHDFEAIAAPQTPAPAPGALAPVTRTVLAAPARFDGMPLPRWWAFEDERTNLGLVDAATTDLAKLLFVEFGLVCSNDWFVIPCTLDVGVASTVRGIAVADVFGDRFWIEPAGAEAATASQRWTMFTLGVYGSAGAPVDQALLVLPTAAKIQDGDPHEDVLLIRDEVANMVWGVERRVTLPSGESKQGSEAAFETRGFHQALVGPPPAPPPGAQGAAVRYQLMSGVAEHLIPFIPAHADGDNREVQLQRAAMPRVIAGGPQPPDPIRPRTSLLREGLDASPAVGYRIHEEEVPRAGTHLTVNDRRARTRDGRVLLWCGVRRESGRGEGSSTLAFDQLIDLPPR